MNNRRSTNVDCTEFDSIKIHANGTSRAPSPTKLGKNSLNSVPNVTLWSVLGGGTKTLAGANLWNSDQDVPIQKTNERNAN